MRGRVRARVQARPHELADLERVVERRYGGVRRRAARPTKRRAKPRALAAELDAAVADGRIVASRRAHYERLAREGRRGQGGQAAASPRARDRPATSAALALPADAPSRDEPWMTPQRRVAPGQVLSAGRAPELAAAEPPVARAAPRASTGRSMAGRAGVLGARPHGPTSTRRRSPHRTPRRTSRRSACRGRTATAGCPLGEVGQARSSTAVLGPDPHRRAPERSCSPHGAGRAFVQGAAAVAANVPR